MLGREPEADGPCPLPSTPSPNPYKIYNSKSTDLGFCQFAQKNRQIPDLIDNLAGRGQPGYQ